MKATYNRVSPYQQDAMNLSVADLASAVPFYETIMGFHVVSREDMAPSRAILARDAIQIGLAENGGDPTKDGCFFEVDDIEAAFAELKANGLGRDNANYRFDEHGDKTFRVFFVVAPDGLCYCLGQQVSKASK